MVVRGLLWFKQSHHSTLTKLSYLTASSSSSVNEGSNSNPSHRVVERIQ